MGDSRGASVVGVILAAGRGRRMGMPKALLTWRRRTFIDHLIHAQTLAGIHRVLVVTQAHLQAQLEPKSEFTHAMQMHTPSQPQVDWLHSSPEAPPLHSLHLALEHLEAQSLAPALLIGPVDQGPYPTELVQGLLDGFEPQGDAIHIPTFEQQPGHPVLVGAGCLEWLRRDHPQGLRGIFQEHLEHCVHVPLPHPEIPRNLNTREQYQAFLDE